MSIGYGKITLLAICVGAFILFVLLFLFWNNSDVYTYIEPQLHIGEMDTSVVSAHSWVVFDVETGAILSSKNAEEVVPIASITKLVTASAVLENSNLDATTSVLWSDVAEEGEAGKLHFKDVYSKRELLYPLLLESSNDAATTLARINDNLPESMNNMVSLFGLQRTHFVDASGLSEKNVSSANELAILSGKLFKQQPHLFDITRLEQFIGTLTGWRNNNPLVSEEGYRGGKHGFTTAANRTAVAFFDEALAGGSVRTIGYVVLGSDSIKTDITLLREEVHKNIRFE